MGYAVKWGNAEMAKMHEHEQVAAVLTATLTLLLPDSKTSYCLRGGETICPR